MPSIPQPELPRLVVYYQTLHTKDDKPISVLPLLTNPGISITHLILAAFHINADASKLTLNDHSPTHPRNQTLWAEIKVLQASGIKVLGLLGGAAQGSYQRLDRSADDFEKFYCPMRDVIREQGLDGIDLDVEEETSLKGIIRLIDRLRADFGKDLIISMSPVAMAMLDYTKNMSGFDYEALEVMRGKDIAFYNCQCYNGWGDCSNPVMYDLMLRKGWPPQKLVIASLTNPSNGHGFVPLGLFSALLELMKMRYGNKFGGVAGWEYFNSLPGGRERPWEWAKQVTGILRPEALIASTQGGLGSKAIVEADPDVKDAKAVEVPAQFDYFSDGLDED